MKNKKTKALLASVAAVAVCSSIIAGSTLAMFTSESAVNVAVTTGKISVSAKIGTPVVYTAQGGEALNGLNTDELEYAGEYTGIEGVATDYYYVENKNSDKATVEGNEVTLNNIAAGDKVEFTITVENHSTLDVKYRTKLSLVDGSSVDLMRALDFSIGDEDFSAIRSYKSAWEKLSAPEDAEKGETVITYTATIALPLGVKEVEGQTCKLVYAVEAVQDNEVTVSGEEKDVIGVYSSVKTTEELKEALDFVSVNGGYVKLANDVKLDNGFYVFGKETTIDLNGNTLSGTDTSLYEGLVAVPGGYSIVNDSELTVKNGTIDVTFTKSNNLFYAYNNLTLENVVAQLPVVDNDEKIAQCVVGAYYNPIINIKGCTLSAKSYAIATNGGVGVSPTFNIEDSTLGGENTYDAICLNVPGTLTAKNCTISGTWQAANIRGGSATFENCTLTKLGEGGKMDGEAWDQGAGVAAAALSIGNKMKTANDTSYQYPASVTLIDTDVTTIDGYYTVYMYGNVSEGNGAKLTYCEDNCNLGEVVQGDSGVNTEVVAFNAAKDSASLAQSINEVGMAVLAEDVELDDILSVTGDTAIYGNGNKLVAPKSTQTGWNLRVINVSDVNNATLYLSGVELEGPTTGTYTRGISIYNSDNVKILMDNCKLSANYYALNVASDCDNLEVIVRNSTLDGWCAAQTWSANSKITFENCVLNGLNDKPAGNSNDFATFVINDSAAGSEITFKDCTITANTTSTNRQFFLSIRTSATINVSGCTFVNGGAEITDLNEILNNVAVYAGLTINFTFDGEEFVINT